MSSQIKLKRSGVAGKAPESAKIALGEVVLNYTDGKLYFKDANGVLHNFDASAITPAGGTITGTLNVPTQTSSTSSTAAASTEFVQVNLASHVEEIIAVCNDVATKHSSVIEEEESNG